jgi:NAD(P)-dependent dehydrogenase (short-subunit alcohol dehydrogenase family)
MALDMTKLVPLVTGGGSGIGYGLVKQFLALGCPKVIITGRTEARLQVRALNAFFSPKPCVCRGCGDYSSALCQLRLVRQVGASKVAVQGAARAHSLTRCAS